MRDQERRCGRPRRPDGPLGDLDGDGDLDWLGVRVDSQAPHQVWLNDAGRFTRVERTFGGDAPAWGVALGDLDGDRDLDAYVSTSGGPLGCPPDEVWLNDGHARFRAGSRACVHVRAAVRDSTTSNHCQVVSNLPRGVQEYQQADLGYLWPINAAVNDDGALLLFDSWGGNIGTEVIAVVDSRGTCFPGTRSRTCTRPTSCVASTKRPVPSTGAAQPRRTRGARMHLPRSWTRRVACSASLLMGP
jgi:hypothetical protein